MTGDFSERIRLLRGDISQKDFAQLVGVNINSLRHYEKGVRRPNVDIVVNICRHTGASPDWLILGEGPMRRHDRSTVSVPVDGKEAVRRDEAVRKLTREIEELRAKLKESDAEPERNLVIPVLGLAECSLSGWYTFTNTALYTVAPVDIAKSKGGFSAIAIGDSMVPAGIEPGAFVFCDPNLEPKVGDAVFVERIDGHATIKIYAGISQVAGNDMIRLHGWLPRNKDNPSLPQKPFTLEESKKLIKRVAPVVYVKRRP
jgi:transcriptional regulator with XRE-family HTH domain